MCRICVEWEKEKMTNKEALNAIGELLADSDEETKTHLFELVNRVIDEEELADDSNTISFSDLDEDDECQ